MNQALDSYQNPTQVLNEKWKDGWIRLFLNQVNG